MKKQVKFDTYSVLGTLFYLAWIVWGTLPIFTDIEDFNNYMIINLLIAITANSFNILSVLDKRQEK